MTIALLFFAGAAFFAIGDGVLKERNKSGQRCERNAFMALVAFVSNTINNKDSDKEGLILSQPSADSSLCGGSLWGAASADAEGISPLRARGGGFPIAPATPSDCSLCN